MGGNSKGSLDSGALDELFFPVMIHSFIHSLGGEREGGGHDSASITLPRIVLI